jgi:hypothetical protein
VLIVEVIAMVKTANGNAPGSEDAIAAAPRASPLPPTPSPRLIGFVMLKKSIRMGEKFPETKPIKQQCRVVRAVEAPIIRA